jgi:hypothetical protein
MQAFARISIFHIYISVINWLCSIIFYLSYHSSFEYFSLFIRWMQKFQWILSRLHSQCENKTYKEEREKVHACRRRLNGIGMKRKCSNKINKCMIHRFWFYTYNFYINFLTQFSTVFANARKKSEKILFACEYMFFKSFYAYYSVLFFYINIMED